MITAKGSFDDMRQGFLSGSEDYMVKPVNVNEMVLRVGAQMCIRDRWWLDRSSALAGANLAMLVAG